MMSNNLLKPLLLTPPVKDYIWGGTRLIKEFGRQCSSGKAAESWELSCHKDGCSVIASGEFAGKTLSDFIGEHREVLGYNCEKYQAFPVMVKLIDACDNLSVQVHPDDDYALRVEGEFGKTEMWYVVDCDEGATLIYGFKEQLTRDEFRQAIEENTLMDKVNVVPVKKGDVFLINAGTLHAIGRGILIAEIQQNSNSTYRVYDYGRVGADGKPRELHIEKALDVTKLTPSEPFMAAEPVELKGSFNRLLAENDIFFVEHEQVFSEVELCADGDSFQHILVLDGEGVLSADSGETELKKGSSVFIPAGMGEYVIKGNCSILITEAK